MFYIGLCEARSSLAAAEQLSRAGYGTLAWINGGLDTAKKTDLPVKGEFDDLRYGGIGGMSELLGWTDVQTEKNSGFLGARRRHRVMKLPGMPRSNI